MMTFIWGCLVILTVAMIVIVIRLVKGPTVADRIIALMHQESVWFPLPH